jgi:hypothetical protein
MRSSAPALLPVFRSRLQADILAALLLNPDAEYSLTELAQRFQAPLSTVHGEVKPDRRGLRRRGGRPAMVRANPDNRLTQPLAELLLLSRGPPVGRGVLRPGGGRTGADLRLWQRYRDILVSRRMTDVLVVGRPSRDDVYDAADRAQQRLGMPVNPVIRTADARLASDPLVRQIQSSPLVTVLAPTTAPPAPSYRAV